MSPRPASGRRRVLTRGAGLGLIAVGATGCTRDEWSRFGFKAPITTQGHRVLGLWVGSTWAALAVGAFVLGLILFACVAYRKRGEELPRQVHYNVPIEILYTVVPFVIVSVLFYFTAVDETYVNKLTKKPDMTVGVVGFQWSWHFDYPDEDLQIVGRPSQPPQLVIPTNRTILFVETSPDVIHSWWVPDFLFKRDVIPGRKNKFEVTVDKTGTYKGRCAELCGIYHSRMLFSVRVVTPEQFRVFVRDAKAQAQNGSPIYSTSTSGSSS